MRRVLLALMILCYPLTAHAALTLQEVRTASNNVIVVYFKSTTINATEVNTASLAQWTVNGQPVTAINKYVMQADSCDHYIYLTVPPLVSGTSYQVQTPHGNATLVFDERKTFCESIKTNQAAYSALSKNNYANFAIWLGDGGSQQISGALPTYEVFNTLTNNVVAQGTLQQIGADATSGDFVYRINLAAVPAGGPYKISVKGYGASYPFGVGADFSRRLAYIIFRGQYYQRCGCASAPPLTLDIRKKPCHTTVYSVGAPIAEASLVVPANAPGFTIYGGYHDAGDADRRAYHMANPIVNLMVYEAFPALFTDDQYDIPDKFDANYDIVGKGNGIPDIIDEAAWGTLVWEYLQNADGSIPFGTETKGYPSPFDAPLDQDTLKWGTEVNDDRPAAVAPGLFLHLARMLQPYDATHSQQLAERAQRSFNYIGTRIANPEKLYYYIQKYLFDGDENAHTQVKALQNAVDSYRNNTRGTLGYSLNNAAFDNPGYIVSYMVEKTRPTDAAVVTHFMTALKAAADSNVAELNKYAYPVGNNPSSGGWGHNVRQPSYAAEPLLYWRFSNDQAYLDAAASLMNYTLGLNPLGISYVTGLGFHQIHNPHDRESAYTKRMGWGPKPGITVFGPGIPGSGTTTTVPAMASLPSERKFADNMSAISMAEFTIFETMTHYALYTVLAGGGKWDPTKDPFTTPGTGGSGSGGAGNGGSTSTGGTASLTGGTTTTAGGTTATGGSSTVSTGGVTTGAGGWSVSAGGTTAASGGSGSTGSPEADCSCSAVRSTSESRWASAWMLTLLGFAAIGRRRRR